MKASEWLMRKLLWRAGLAISVDQDFAAARHRLTVDGNDRLLDDSLEAQLRVTRAAERDRVADPDMRCAIHFLVGAHAPRSA